MHARVRQSLALLVLLTPLVAWPTHQAGADDDLGPDGVVEQDHRVELTPGPEGVTLAVTRRFFNPTAEHGKLDLSIDLPCDATLDRLELRGRDDARGREVWVPGRIVDPDVGAELFGEHMYPSEQADALEGDTLALLTHGHFGCSARLELYPVPPFGERSVRYRVFLPSEYQAGRHHVELPRLGLSNTAPQIEVHAPAPGLELAIDVPGPIKSWPTILDGSVAHTLALTRSDAMQATLELASLDLAQHGGSDARVSIAKLDVPRQLADLPEVRRVVVVVDASHSFADNEREGAQELVAGYLAALDPAVPVELLTFDRELQRVYGQFVPAAWAAEDLAKLEPETRNGSEVGKALAAARTLLSEARREDDRAGVDWIVLLGDLELRRDFELEAERRAAAASDIRLHVVRGTSTYEALRPGSLDGEWMAIAQAAGGAHFEQGRQAERADGRELLAPSRVWDLQLIYTSGGEPTTLPLAVDVYAGESHRWLDMHESAVWTEIEYRGFVWAGNASWRARVDADATRRWAGRLATDEALGLDLSDADREALARFTEVISPFTALLAEARFDGRSPGPQLGFGSMGFGGSGGSSSCGGGLGLRGKAATPGDGLAALLAAGLATCEQLDAGRLELEVRGREIVRVSAPHRCPEQVAWDLDLRAHAVPDSLVEVEYGPTGFVSLTSR